MCHLLNCDSLLLYSIARIIWTYVVGIIIYKCTVMIPDTIHRRTHGSLHIFHDFFIRWVFRVSRTLFHCRGNRGSRGNRGGRDTSGSWIICHTVRITMCSALGCLVNASRSSFVTLLVSLNVFSILFRRRISLWRWLVAVTFRTKVCHRNNNPRWISEALQHIHLAADISQF